MKPTSTKNISNNLLHSTDKKQLKVKILQSAYSFKKRRKIRNLLGYAASLVLIIGLTNYTFFNTQTSSINTYLDNNTIVDTDTIREVKLILSETQNISIVEDNSTIKYSSTGNNVNINNKKTIQQSKKPKQEIVFNTLVVPYGKRSKIELSDGSIVWLNSGSKLVYPKKFIGKNREVYIEGEAIFDVSHNKNHPFIVKATNYEIEVLGTLFNVSNYSEDKTVSTVLKHGSVQIQYKGNNIFSNLRKVKIVPGTKATYIKANNTLNVKEVVVDNYFLWREGKMLFKNDNLNTIMKKLSRYYNVSISIDNKELNNETFSGTIDLKENIEDIIKLIKETTFFDYEINNNNYTIINRKQKIMKKLKTKTDGVK